MKWIALSAETRGVVRDQNGVPVEWTLLHIGSNPICQEGRDGALVLSAEAMDQIMEYHLGGLCGLRGLRAVHGAASSTMSTKSTSSTPST